MSIHDLLLGRIKKKKMAHIKIKHLELPRMFYCHPSDKMEYVTSRLKTCKQSLLAAFHVKQFAPVNLRSKEPFYTYGLITSVTGSKLKDDVFIHNTLDGSNDIVKLNLEYLKEYSLFQGMVVGIKGINPYGNELIVERLCLPVQSVNTNQRNELSTLIVKGPFSEESLAQFISEDPEVLILLGSFSEGELDDFIVTVENSLKKNCFTQVVLVPSLDDQNYANVLPQPPIKTDSARIVCVSNPGSFYINNNYVVVCNYDSMMDLSVNEIYKENPEIEKHEYLFAQDRVGRLSGHLAFQRSLVPVLPSSLNVSYGEWIDLDVAPDIFILSSKINHFYRISGASQVINVGNQANCGFYRIERVQGKYNVEFKNK